MQHLAAFMLLASTLLHDFDKSISLFETPLQPNNQKTSEGFSATSYVVVLRSNYCMYSITTKSLHTHVYSTPKTSPPYPSPIHLMVYFERLIRNIKKIKWQNWEIKSENSGFECLNNVWKKLNIKYYSSFID